MIQFSLFLLLQTLLQHKYKETVLFFPSAGQTCHAYCTFCFRWPQFVGMEDMKFDARECSDFLDPPGKLAGIVGLIVVALIWLPETKGRDLDAI